MLDWVADPCCKAHGLLMQLYLLTTVLNEQIGREVLFGACEASAADVNALYSSLCFSSRGHAEEPRPSRLLLGSGLLCGVLMFSKCLRGLTLGTLAQKHA